MGWVVVALAVVVFLVSVTLLLRRILASHDEIYDGLTPGVLPPREERKTTPTKRLRSTEYKGPFPVAFTPPRDVTPGLIGMVIDGVVDPRDLTATIVDLAARGFLRIEVLDDGKGKRRGKDWLLHPCDKPRSNLMRYERTFLEGVFPRGRAMRMSELVRRHKKVFRQLTADIYEEASRRGWYRQNPNPGGRRHRFWRVAAGAVAGFAALAISGGDNVGPLAAALFVATGLGAAFGPKRRVPRTGAGTATRIQALGSTSRPPRLGRSASRRRRTPSAATCPTQWSSGSPTTGSRSSVNSPSNETSNGTSTGSTSAPTWRGSWCSSCSPRTS